MSVMKGFIQKYILPREVDFNAAFQQQVEATGQTVADLCSYCLQQDEDALQRVLQDEHHCTEIKSRNMRELLNVFITPYDRESIYRVINQLEWVALSVKHLAKDLEIYKPGCTVDYSGVFEQLQSMAKDLADGFSRLGTKQLTEVVGVIDAIYVEYDKVVETCSTAIASHLQQDEMKQYLAHREILLQLKEVAKRIRVTGSTLEDLVIKSV
jgi:uncharacterized protein Yka (UPF0111/DUF47 family)